MEPYLGWAVDEHGKYRKMYRIIDDLHDVKHAGYRRERVSWTLTNAQERKLLQLDNSVIVGQGSAIFEWAAQGDTKMMTDTGQILDVPTLSAVIGLGQKKGSGVKAEKADGDTTK
eukprot:251441-Pyramimonas_sp.AAC.1